MATFVRVGAIIVNVKGVTSVESNPVKDDTKRFKVVLHCGDDNYSESIVNEADVDKVLDMLVKAMNDANAKPVHVCESRGSYALPEK
jgi:hypothetical protein